MGGTNEGTFSFFIANEPILLILVLQFLNISYFGKKTTHDRRRLERR